MAEVSSNDVTCPNCNFHYEYRTRLPDICTSCFYVINQKPQSQVFATPDYLSFQIEDIVAKAKDIAQGKAATATSPAVSPEDAKANLSAEAVGELETFVKTCSFETHSALLAEVDLFLCHLPHNINLKRDEMVGFVKKLKELSTRAEGLIAWINGGGFIPYERRLQTIKTADQGTSGGDSLDTSEEGDNIILS